MIQRKSQKLVDEDHDPWKREAAGNGSERDRQSLGELKVSFDHCWDLSRQHRELRGAGRGRGREGADLGSGMVELYER